MDVVKYIVESHNGKVKVSDVNKYRVMGFNDRLRNMNIYTFDWA
jgi:penicillin V acylase-like amidase (Ntn superfamily)